VKRETESLSLLSGGLEEKKSEFEQSQGHLRAWKQWQGIR
jgi:hypothetical protein